MVYGQFFEKKGEFNRGERRDFLNTDCAVLLEAAMRSISITQEQRLGYYLFNRFPLYHSLFSIDDSVFGF